MPRKSRVDATEITEYGEMRRFATRGGVEVDRYFELKFMTLKFRFEKDEIPKDVRNAVQPSYVRVQYVPGTADGSRLAAIRLFRKDGTNHFASQTLDDDELAVFVSKGFAATE